MSCESAEIVSFPIRVCQLNGSCCFFRATESEVSQSVKDSVAPSVLLHQHRLVQQLLPSTLDLLRHLLPQPQHRLSPSDSRRLPPPVPLAALQLLPLEASLDLAAVRPMLQLRRPLPLLPINLRLRLRQHRSRRSLSNLLLQPRLRLRLQKLQLPQRPHLHHPLRLLRLRNCPITFPSVGSITRSSLLWKRQSSLTAKTRTKSLRTLHPLFAVL